MQDVEIPLGRTADFLGWFLREVPIRPFWLCPVRMRSTAPWPLYPLDPGVDYVNVGFWSTVPIGPGGRDGDANRRVEDAVAAHGGHKSLYSDAYYDEDRFWALYGGTAYRDVKHRYDPDGRLLALYAKAVKRR